MSSERPDGDRRDRQDPDRKEQESPVGPGGVGGSSGAEAQPRERTVPGTASAREGYQPDHGTGSGSPLEGVEIDPDEQQEIHPSDDEDQPDAGPVRRSPS
ncbi:hypothetical protein ABZX88_21835 [Kitasatospora aureofaciens]|uniref:hypothetical protein n=1 Tax=Kitasatospora aureofaciens TaxID=1894 RepID=UPI0033B5122C